METIIKAMETCGMLRTEAEATIKTRRAAFNKATREYDKETFYPGVDQLLGVNQF